MSDLHMELWDNSRYIQANEFDVMGDVLVLAGDTFYLRDTVAPQKKFWNWASNNFRQVLLVPGNHALLQNWVTILPTAASMHGFMDIHIRTSIPR